MDVVHLTTKIILVDLTKIFDLIKHFYFLTLTHGEAVCMYVLIKKFHISLTPHHNITSCKISESHSFSRLIAVLRPVRPKIQTFYGHA